MPSFFFFQNVLLTLYYCFVYSSLFRSSFVLSSSSTLVYAGKFLFLIFRHSFSRTRFFSLLLFSVLDCWFFLVRWRNSMFLFNFNYVKQVDRLAFFSSTLFCNQIFSFFLLYKNHILFKTSKKSFQPCIYGIGSGTTPQSKTLLLYEPFFRLLFLQSSVVVAVVIVIIDASCH